MPEILHLHSFVIEMSLPDDRDTISVKEKQLHPDQKSPTIRYTWFWFQGFSVMPGAGETINGKTMPYVPVNVWTPYFSDAEVFKDREQAEECRNKMLDKYSGCVVVPVNLSHADQSWEFKNGEVWIP